VPADRQETSPPLRPPSLQSLTQICCAADDLVSSDMFLRGPFHL